MGLESKSDVWDTWGMARSRILVPISGRLARCNACNRVFARRTDDPLDLNRQFEEHKCNSSEDAA
jgi:hypothetical protein